MYFRRGIAAVFNDALLSAMMGQGREIHSPVLIGTRYFSLFFEEINSTLP